VAGDVEIRGAKQQFLSLAKRLNEQGSSGKGLWKELNSEIKTAAKPMSDTVLRHLENYLPDRYAKVLRATLTIRVSRATRGAAAGLKLVGVAKGRSRKRHVKTIDQGTLRHPVWGNVEVWVDQSVKAGFWSNTLDQTRDIPAKAIRRAVANTARKL
jgi:hypothetical protein